MTWQDVFYRLSRAFGPQRWWPARSVWEVAAGCVLVQGTSWRNAELALESLRRAGRPSPEALLSMTPSTVGTLIRSSGYFRQKALRLGALAAEVERYGSLAGFLDTARRLDDDALRVRFLSIPGIGPETADCLLLYAAGRPAFVADAYARRIGVRLGLVPPDAGYEDARRRALDAWRPSPGVETLAEMHALLVELGKRHCRKLDPDCPSCPLRAGCAAAGGEAGRPAPARRPAHSPGRPVPA